MTYTYPDQKKKKIWTYTYLHVVCGRLCGGAPNWAYNRQAREDQRPRTGKAQHRPTPDSLPRVHAHLRMTSSLDSSWSECSSPWLAIKGRCHNVVICRKNILVYQGKTRVATTRGGSRTCLFSTWCCHFGLSLHKRCVTLPPLRGRDQPCPPHSLRPKKVRQNSRRFNGRHVVVRTDMCNNARDFLTVGWDVTDTLGGLITFRRQNTWVPIIWRPNWLPFLGWNTLEWIVALYFW